MTLHSGSGNIFLRRKKEDQMPYIKTRNLFISHAWKYEEHYWKVVEWFKEEPNFSWNNYSVPSHDSCTDTTIKGLKDCLTAQIRPSQGVIILAGMYAAHSGWIDYEIDEAVRMGKTIIGVRPWGQERTPIKVQEAAGLMVSWNRSSIIQAVRNLI